MLVNKWQFFLACVTVGVILAFACTAMAKNLMIVLTSILGAFLVFYNFGYILGALGNFFDMIERFKSGQPMVSLLGARVLCVLWSHRYFLVCRDDHPV